MTETIFGSLPHAKKIAGLLALIFKNHQVYPLYYCLSCCKKRLENLGMGSLFAFFVV
jgi:hypothetical protein